MIKQGQPWSEKAEDTAAGFDVNADSGLSAAEAARRLAKYGANRLQLERRISFWGVFKEEITEPLILLLLFIGVVYSIWGELRDAITIFIIITALVLTEIFTEYRAKRAVASLRRLTPPETPVLRSGKYEKLMAQAVVPGDILILEAGERLPADGRLIESLGLEVDESSLTGESVAIPKSIDPLPATTPLAERANMVFAGTTVTRGSGKAIVTATGPATELGKITGLVLEAKEPKTPLQLAMKQLAGLLLRVAIFFSILIPALGILQGKPVKEMVLTGLSLSFATVPEELPIIVTMVLGVGALALSRQNVLIRRLRAAETLGDVTVIATDKTGTITQNKMKLASTATDGTVHEFEPKRPSSGELPMLQAALLTSCTHRTGGKCYTADPLEIALLEAAQAAGISVDDLLTPLQLVREFSFDNSRKMMSVVFQSQNGFAIYAKGAPEVILAASTNTASPNKVQARTDEDDQTVRSAVDQIAAGALRVIAFAFKETEILPSGQQEAESGLTLLGLAGLEDPPRPEVKAALELTRKAGIRTIIVSGDHPMTIEKVAQEVGIDGNADLCTGTQLDGMDDARLAATLDKVSLYARTTPEEKLRIVTTLQKKGEIVAVTGDGINDAPALKSANIGIAMGETGTDVAREAAAMVLRDDSFASIVAGVREGRKIFDNLTKGVSYYLAVKLALVTAFVVPLLLSKPFPFSPIQIILLELFMDLAASATFVAEPMEPGTMDRPPRRTLRFVDREMLSTIFSGSLSLAAAVLINYLWATYSGWSTVEAQTLAFATWLIGHVVLALTMRSRRTPLLRAGLTTNRVMLVWAASVVVFLFVTTGIPPVQQALKLTSLSLNGWLLALIVPLVTMSWLELRKLWHSPARPATAATT